MSDNITKRPFLKTKLQNLLKIYQNLTFCKFDSNVAKWQCFYSHYKKSQVSIFYSYRDLAWTKHKFKKCFFWLKLPQFLAKFNFDILLHNFSRYVIFGFLCKFFARKVLGDMARRRKALQTDGRTDIHGGKKQYMSPAGGDI